MNSRYEEILILLYRFRFLTRQQLQELVGHKHNGRILQWLNDLTKDDFIIRYYNQKNIISPAVYSIGLKGRSYLKKNSKELKINTIVLNRIWREQTLSVQFRFHCLTIVDIYLSLLKLTNSTGAQLRFFTKSDLHNVIHLPTPFPDIFFHITEKSGFKRYYFLDVFNYFTNQKKFQKRIEQYYDYYDDEIWQDNVDDSQFPIIIFVCSDKKSYGYLNWYLSTKILAENDTLDFYLTTKEIIKTEGLTRNSLKKVIAKDDN